MTGGRETVLGALRNALGRPNGLAAVEQAAVEARLAKHERHLIPARGQIPHDEQVKLFRVMAEEAAATVAQVAALDDVPGAVADYLRGHNLPPAVALAPDPALKDVRWQTQPSLTVREGKAEPPDLASVTGAFAAIAESGTLMLISGHDSPTTLNFLPDNHIVVLDAAKVLGSYEEAWSALRERRAQDGGWTMPRTVNLITGPSRSADIEQTLILGAHGPRRLHIILVGS